MNQRERVKSSIQEMLDVAAVEVPKKRPRLHKMEETEVMAFLLSGGKSTEESSDSNAGEAASSGSDTDDHRTPLEEFNDYLRSSSPGLSTNPLDWWNENSDRFPLWQWS